MALTAEQLARREGKITASFLPQLMAGDREAIHQKWLELVGDPNWQPEDLSNNRPVQFGSFIETFALDWHERKTQCELTRRGEVVDHPTRPYVCATLDAYRAADRCVIDAKANGAWMRLDEVLAFYTPQLLVQKGCVQSDNASLLIVHGGGEPTEYPITIDPEYERTVWERIDQFWQCVEMMMPPVETMKLQPLTPPEQWRSFDLDQEDQLAACNNWAPDMMDQLAVWSQTSQQAKDNEAACKLIKQLLPEDCGKVTWAGLIVQRNRARAVSIKRRKE
jgi:hypothetical protein